MSPQGIAAINQCVDHWAADIWRACWQGSAAILLVWALCRMLPRMSPPVRCWLWRLAYVKLLIALLWTSPVELPLLRSPGPPSPTAAPIQARAAVPPTPPVPQSHVTETDGPAHSVVTQTSLTPLSALTLFWLLGVMVAGAQVVWEWRLARRNRCAAPLDATRHPVLAADFERLCRRFGVVRPIALLVTGASDRPHVFGVTRPAIVLPVEMLEESDHTRLMAVLAHEVAHVQRKDLLWNWLPTIAHALFFFCPLVWLANREWQLAQEIACDEMAVVNTRTDAADYGEMLVRMVAPQAHTRGRGIASLGIIETPQTLKRRLIAMRFIQPISRRKLVLAGFACASLGIFGIVPWQVVAQEARTNRILFVSNRVDAQRFSIFAMDPDGSHVVRLTHGPVPEFDAVATSNGKTVLLPTASHQNVMELDPVWSPDGKRIAFTLAVPEKPERDSKVKMNVYVMNADGSACKQTTYFAYGMEATSPAWSPDGKCIAFTLQMREKGAPAGIDTTVCVTDLTGWWPIANGMWPSWSKDGKKVLFSAYADRTGTTTDLHEAKFTGAEGSEKKLLDGVLQAALSPDGKRLAYLSNTADPNNGRTRKIYVSNADGSDPKPLTAPQDTGPVGFQWSSDGRQIYFTRPEAPDAAGAVNYRIYAMDADGGHLRALTEGAAPDYLGGAPGPFLAHNWMNRIAGKK